MSTDLGPLYLGDVYKQAARFGGQLDTTLRALGDWFGTDSPIDVSTFGVRLGRVAFLELVDGADNTARLTAFIAACATNCTVFITEPGTYTIGGANLASYAFKLVGNSGVIFKQINSATAAMLTVSSNTTFEGIEFDGNKDEQGADHQIIYASNPTALRVRRCTFTNGYFHFVQVDDGTDVKIEGSSFTDCNATAVQFYVKTSAGLTRCKVRDCLIDRTTNDTGTGGGVKFTWSAGSGDMLRCKIEDCDILLHPGASITDYIGAEFWGNAGTVDVLRCKIVNCNIEGGEIGASMDTPIDCQIQGNIVNNTEDAGIEIVRPTRTQIQGNTVNGNGSTNNGIVVDCQATTLEGNSVVGNTVTEFTGSGVRILGSGSGRPDRSLVATNNISSSVNGAEGVSVITAQRCSVTANVIKMSGTGGYGVASGTGANGLSVKDNDISVAAGLACVRSADNNNITITGNNLVSLSGTTATGYDIVNATDYEVTGGTITGTFTTGCNLKADGSGKTVDRGKVGGWSGNNSIASINPTAVNSGTFGTGNWAIPTPGWLPFGTITMAMIRLATSFSDWLFVYGTRLGGTPTEGVADGSMLTDETNGIPYARLSGAWQPWLT